MSEEPTEQTPEETSPVEAIDPPETSTEPESRDRRWLTDPPAGPKVCTLRQDSTQLVHTGLASGWNREDVEAYFAECASELVRLPDGAMQPPSEMSETVVGWGEAVRFAQEEFWSDARGQGTTLAIRDGDLLHVISRGDHRVSITSPTGDAEAGKQTRPEWGGKYWQLPAEEDWSIEVALRDGPGPVWRSRWTDAPAEPPRSARPVVEVTGEEPEAVGPNPWQRVVERWPFLDEPVWRRRLAWGGGALSGIVVLLGVIAAIPKDPLREAWVQFGDYMAGEYRVQVTSWPEGGRILIDGRDTDLLTPSELLLEQGEHTVTIDFEEFGSGSTEINGERGGRTSTEVQVLGSVVIGNADSSLSLYARLDGQAIGELPVLIDSVPVGRRTLSFQGRDAHPWSEEVDILSDRTTQLIAKPERVPTEGVVLARAYQVSASGVEEVRGAAVYLNGRRVAYTPARISVERGMHTVRLTTRDARSPVQLLRVEGGAELYATAEFGRSPEPEVIPHVPADGYELSPPVLRATLESPMPIRVRRMWLYSRWPGEEFERKSMQIVTGQLGLTGEIVAPIEGWQPGTQLEYFFQIESDQGEDFVSEIHYLRVRPGTPSS